MILNALRDANGAELQAIDVFALHGIRSSDAAKRAAALEELRASQHTTSMHQMLASAASAATMNASATSNIGQDGKEPSKRARSRSRDDRAFGPRGSPQVSYFDSTAAQRFPLLSSRDVAGAPISAGHSAFSGLRNDPCPTQRLAVASVDFAEQLLTLAVPTTNGHRQQHEHACLTPVVKGESAISLDPCQSFDAGTFNDFALSASRVGRCCALLDALQLDGDNAALPASLFAVHFEPVEHGEDGEEETMALASFDIAPPITSVCAAVRLREFTRRIGASIDDIEKSRSGVCL